MFANTNARVGSNAREFDIRKSTPPSSHAVQAKGRPVYHHDRSYRVLRLFRPVSPSVTVDGAWWQHQPRNSGTRTRRAFGDADSFSRVTRHFDSY